MGTNPGTGKMPNRGLGRQIGTEDSSTEDKEINVQEISMDPHTANNPGGGTNFQRQKKVSEDSSH